MFKKLFKQSAALMFVLSLLFAAPASAKVSVTTGPTPIPGGEALDKKDITLANDLYAVSIAVGALPPWGT